ncbi:MAG: hypothetical protein A3H93_18690 [Rhodocyclales bacterium RIFCSPLOWO2_02_FULL_63_24]|nr:MAG: hypothetical protein A2040_18350 [Rhodocyclales bacterium GWA2_65_19]OHC69915.1 MAG: hypothetical protein A3H93_18690 [Rhodocyclales bacterium RIFCSPLOWO2_02_FULL_63_24]
MSDLRPAARLPLLVLGMLSLLGGVLAGLARLDWGVPAVAAGAAGWHGALMISAFLGTVIGLERAVALGRGWAYLAPAAAGLGGMALLAGAPLLLAQLLAVAAATVLLAASVQVLLRLVAPFTLILAVGALCWLIGNLVWLWGGVLNAAVAWWLAFLVLTIAGERLELTRFLPTPVVAQRVFFAIVGSLLAGAALGLREEDAGLALFAAGLLALALWLLRYDIARRNAGQAGLTRFIALCLLSGYAWLVLAGLLGLAGGLLPGHPWHDATLHAVGLGFVFSMIFGHAAIIFPAVLRVRIPYHPAFYLPLLVLHASLALRIFGSLSGQIGLRSEGALVNAIALLLFIATMLVSVGRGRRSVPQPPSHGPTTP